MRFEVSRTSVWGDDTPPVEGAFRSTFPYWHTRTCNEEYFNENFAPREGLWRSNGTDHHVDPAGNITRRQEDRTGWAINIESIDDLIAFVDKYGSCIVAKSDNVGDAPIYEIEIYDDYRE